MSFIHKKNPIDFVFKSIGFYFYFMNYNSKLSVVFSFSYKISNTGEC